jgi:hypothetical protein
MSKLKELRERVERACGDDENLAVDILYALDICSYIPAEGNPLASIDAAYWLVEETMGRAHRNMTIRSNAILCGDR